MHLQQRAASIRDQAYGRVLTYSPKVFLPLTNLCRNICSYCSFRRAPTSPGAYTMSPDAVCASLDAGAAAGCVEALFCLGDTPETGFRSYREQLQCWGFDSTVDYLDWAARQALERGLLPHTNAGILSASAMARLRRVNVSLGLMLESDSDRLCAPGMAHFRAPDKVPARRRAMIAQAGELKIPFTSGVLVGIGESAEERRQAIRALAVLHRAGDHLQEVIIQPFRPHPGTPMQCAEAAPEEALIETVCQARISLPSAVSVQAPPNLAAGAIEALIAAGINDFGGISPVTPDFINPGYPWPQIDALRRRCEAAGFALRPRLPIYPRFVSAPGWLEPALVAAVAAHRLEAA